MPVIIEGLGASIEMVVADVSQTLERVVRLDPGGLRIALTSDSSRQHAAGDVRGLFFRMIDFVVTADDDDRTKASRMTLPEAAVGLLDAGREALDDDAFEPDHISTLLGLRESSEPRSRTATTPTARTSWRGRHRRAVASAAVRSVRLSGAVNHNMLRFFSYNTSSWHLDEPGDWNLCRRMLEAGVRFGWVDRNVTVYYPSTLHSPRRVPAAGTEGQATDT